MIETFQVRIPAGEYSYPELTLCADSYSVSIPPHVTAVARKRPRSFCQKSAGGRFHPNTHTLFTQRSRFGLTMSLSRHSVGTYPETGLHATCQGTLNQSSQLAEPLWTDPGIKSGTSVRELKSPPPKKKEGMRRWGVNDHFPKILTSEEKTTTTSGQEMINMD